MRQSFGLNQIIPSAQVARASKDPEPMLSVLTIYQDSLTRHWATELWERVGQLIGGEGVSRQSWKISDLTEPCVFLNSFRAAAEADVLVVSIRDAGELPIGLYAWIDAWLPRRVGRAGALVALIGVPGQPDAQAGRAHQYLESVARKAGLDFLPHERMLPEESCAPSSPVKIGATASHTIRWAA